MLGLTKNRKSLNDILSTFNKAIADIDELLAGNGEEIQSNNAEICELQETNLTLLAESASAAKVQQRLSELVA